MWLISVDSMRAVNVLSGIVLAVRHRPHDTETEWTVQAESVHYNGVSVLLIGFPTRDEACARLRAIAVPAWPNMWPYVESSPVGKRALGTMPT